MSYPDPEVQASVTYIYLHLYAPPSGSLVPAGVSEKIAGALLLLLSAHSQPLQLHGNALGETWRHLALSYRIHTHFQTSYESYLASEIASSVCWMVAARAGKMFYCAPGGSKIANSPG